MGDEVVGGRIRLEAGDAVLVVEADPASGLRRKRMARVKHTRGGGQTPLAVYPDEPELVPLSSELAELLMIAREFVLAVDDARADGVAPNLGPVLVPFQRLRAATGIGPFLGESGGESR